jgi:hypothetical protein
MNEEVSSFSSILIHNINVLQFLILICYTSNQVVRFLYIVQVGSQKYTRMLKFFLSYFVDSQIQLNWITDYHHLGYITKLGGKKRKEKHWC